MRTLLKYWPHALNIVLAIALIWSLASDTEPPPKPLSSYTQQDLDKAADIKAGMKADDLLKLMGAPIKKEFINGKEEWHYCRTGEAVDEYVAIRLDEGSVTELEQYTVTFIDILFHHTSAPSKELIAATGFGDCKLKVRWGSYGQKSPQRWVPGAAQQGVPAALYDTQDPALDPYGLCKYSLVEQIEIYT